MVVDNTERISRFDRLIDLGMTLNYDGILIATVMSMGLVSLCKPAVLGGIQQINVPFPNVWTPVCSDQCSPDSRQDLDRFSSVFFRMLSCSTMQVDVDRAIFHLTTVVLS